MLNVFDREVVRYSSDWGIPKDENLDCGHDGTVRERSLQLGMVRFAVPHAGTWAGKGGTIDMSEAFGGAFLVLRRFLPIAGAPISCLFLARHEGRVL
jgi:hypothetical protein